MYSTGDHTQINGNKAPTRLSDDIEQQADHTWMYTKRKTGRVIEFGRGLRQVLASEGLIKEEEYMKNSGRSSLPATLMLWWNENNKNIRL